MGGGSLILCKDAAAIALPSDTNILDTVGWAGNTSLASFISSWKEGNICAVNEGITPANSTIARSASSTDTNDNDTDFNNSLNGGTPGAANIIPDTTPPTISSILPSDGQIDVPPTIANIVVNFSEPMDPAVGTVDFSGGTSFIGTSVWSGTSNNIYTIPITSSLALSTMYYLTFNNFTDVAGNALDVVTTINGTAQFTTSATMDTTAPEILSSTPADAATGVSVNLSSISFSFSEGMNTAIGTVTFAGGSGSLGTASWTGNTVVTYPVTGPLSFSTPYIVTLAGFKDIAGNSLNYTSYLADGELNFTTNSGATGDVTKLKISEFQFHGDLSRDEFIEIYNTGTQSVDFSVHPISIQYKACTNTASGFTQILVGIATGSIPANGYYLAVGGSYNGPTPGDITYASDTSGNAATLALVDGTAALSDPNLAIDKLSYNRNSSTCANPLPEGSAKTFTTNTDFFDRSLERRSIGDPGTGIGNDYAGPSGIYYLTGNGLDSSNNDADFVLRLNSLESSGSTGPGPNPQNSSSPTEPNGYVDVTAPTIIGISPSDTETGIATNLPNIVVTFSEAMNTSLGIATLTGGSGTLGAGVWSIGNTVLTLPVSGPLDSSTLYTISFASFTDAAANPLNTVPTINGTSEFTTGSGADVTPPEALSSIPTDATTGVSISIASFSITFNEPMNTTAGSALFAGGIGTISAGVWAGNTVTYTVTGPLAYNTAYTLTLMGLQDVAGNPLSTVSGAVTGGILNFTTEADITPPQILSTTPTDGQVDVSLTLANIKFTFNEAMNTSLGTPTLTGGSGSLGAASWTGSTVVTYPVTGPLAATTAYSVTLAGYQDVAGNALNYTSYLADGILNFTTGAAVAGCVMPTFTGGPKLVISEVNYDDIGTDATEFIEIYNAGDAAADLYQQHI